MKTSNPNNSLVMRGLLGVALALMLQADSGLRAQEGVTIHGDWTIEIRNPDGSASSRHEFKNALVKNWGDPLLARVLAGSMSISFWRIELFANGAVSPCNPSNSTLTVDSACFLVPSNYPASGNNFFKNLTVTENAAALELTGVATASVAGQIDVVQTGVIVAPPLSGGINSFSVTSRTLQAPIPVAKGQIIQVKVVISFS